MKFIFAIFIYYHVIVSTAIMRMAFLHAVVLHNKIIIIILDDIKYLFNCLFNFG